VDLLQVALLLLFFGNNGWDDDLRIFSLRGRVGQPDEDARPSGRHLLDGTLLVTWSIDLCLPLYALATPLYTV